MSGVKDWIDLPDTLKLTSGVSRGSYDLFFIPGNPGLISYYDEFLATLYDEVRLVLPKGLECRAYGRSLAGFETSEQTAPSSPVGLFDVIERIENDLQLYFNSLPRVKGKRRVILLGHSIGSFILLEVLHRHAQSKKEREANFDIVGGICLFPTVVDIAKSPRGLKITWFLKMPYLPSFFAYAVAFILSLMPVSVIRWLLQSILKMPDNAANTSIAFAKSPMGFRQTCYMGRDEMQYVTADRWDAEIWGSANPPAEDRSPAKLFFYFGEDDHWVAKRTRDNLIAHRGRGPGDSEVWKPVMEIDTNGIPHSFPIRFGVPIALKCAEYVHSIVAAGEARPISERDTIKISSKTE